LPFAFVAYTWKQYVTLLFTTATLSKLGTLKLGAAPVYKFIQSPKPPTLYWRVYVIGPTPVEIFHDIETAPPSVASAAKFAGCVGADIVS
jgi:hypothetical protein